MTRYPPLNRIRQFKKTDVVASAIEAQSRARPQPLPGVDHVLERLRNSIRTALRARAVHALWAWDSRQVRVRLCSARETPALPEHFCFFSQPASPLPDLDADCSIHSRVPPEFCIEYRTSLFHDIAHRSYIPPSVPLDHKQD